jgi:hypothetical protein
MMQKHEKPLQGVFKKLRTHVGVHRIFTNSIAPYIILIEDEQWIAAIPKPKTLNPAKPGS